MFKSYKKTRRESADLGLEAGSILVGLDYSNKNQKIITQSYMPLIAGQL